MPRVLRYTAQEAAVLQAAEDLAAKVGVGKKRRKPQIDVDRARKELQGMIQAKNYAQAKPLHMVALYEWAHCTVYKVPPAEFTQKVTWRLAAMAAGKMLKDDFAGDGPEMVNYLRWVWAREAARERRQRVAGSRVGWPLSFRYRALLTDDRVEKARHAS